jgi:WD40 repeat protein
MVNKSLAYILALLFVSTIHTPVIAQAGLSYQQVAVFQLASPSAIAWNPDGTKLAIASYPSIWLWDVASQKLSSLIADAQVSDVAWSPDSSKIASVRGGEDETLLIWDSSTGTLVKQITRVAPYKAFIYTLKWSPDAKRIASDGTGMYILIWNLFGDEKVFPLPGQSGRFGRPHWNSNSSQVASSGGDGVHIWNITTTKNILTIPHVGFDDWNPTDSKILRSGEKGEAYVSVSTTGRVLLKLEHGASILAAQWNFNATLIATGGIDGIVKLWNAQSGLLLGTLKEHSNLISALAWHPTQNWLVTASTDDTVRIWQIDFISK